MTGAGTLYGDAGVTARIPYFCLKATRRSALSWEGPALVTFRINQGRIG